MEKLRKAVNEIAYAQDHAKLSHFQRSLVPVLSFASSIYKLALFLRRSLYHLGLFHQRQLPVPLISVGNLTWGGNGKTPMVEFIALWLAKSGISPLILTRGYGGGDEAKMIQRHMLGNPVKIGVGADRATIAASFLEKYSHVNPHSTSWFDRLCLHHTVSDHLTSEKIGAAILDDGMQSDLNIVMVNGLMLWGNCQLLPHGPLREPLSALRRADIVVIHHADMISEQKLKGIELMIREIKDLPIFFTKMASSHLFVVRDIKSHKSLSALSNSIVLCVSAIGSANAFVQGVKKLGPFYVEQLEFSDHYIFQSKDIELIKRRLEELEKKFDSRPVVIVTEKDYDRDPEILMQLNPYETLALCSDLQIIPHLGYTEECFKKLLKEVLRRKYKGQS